MAETLNLGAGNWATKEDSLLAYNSENGNFKPLPFDFTRASSATVVNKAGLIETVGSGEPRIDFNNDAKGALLLEPTRSNFFLFSEYFLSGAWTKESSTIVADSSISPDGNLNATKLTSNTSSGLIRASYNSSIGVDHTFSFFIKNDNSLSSDITIRTSSTAVNSTINWTNNVLTSITNGTGVTDFESYGNGWYRVFTSYESIEAEQRCKIYASRNGDGASVYIYGAMIEQGSYATSYIPTQGSVVTRSADVCNNGGNEQVINSTEGVLYAEISALADDGDSRRITINDGSTSNRIIIEYSSISNRLSVYLVLSSSNQVSFQYDMSDVTVYSKIAFKYKLNDFSLYVNGIKVLTDTVGNVFTQGTLNGIDLDNSNGNNSLYANVKDIRLYNTALTDAELQALTTI